MSEQRPTPKPVNEAYSSARWALELVRLEPLFALTEGNPEIGLALIDGPAPHTCEDTASHACKHASLVSALLTQARTSSPPGICPACRFLYVPIFSERSKPFAPPQATPSELARAILFALDSGVRIVNLSLALSSYVQNKADPLWHAIDEAQARDVLIVAAVGNAPEMLGSPLLKHPWVLLAAACDASGRLLGVVPPGAALRERSLRAPGKGVPSLGPQAELLYFDGSSAAVPFVAGAAALLLSLFPHGSAAEIRKALLGAAHGNGSRNAPLLDAWGAYERILEKSKRLLTISVNKQAMEDRMDEGRDSLKQEPQGAGDGAPRIQAPRGFSRVLPQGGGDCACGGKGGRGPSIYAIGRIHPRFPSVAIEKELAQVVGRADVAGKTEAQVLHALLSKPENRYLAREMCWVLSIEHIDTYLIAPRFAGDVELLVEAVRSGPRPTDVDVVVGTLGPVAPPWFCNGLELPVVTFDQVWSFDVDSLIKSIPRPESIPEDRFAATAEELFYRILQLADNAGNGDDHRALNYLAVRYPAIYAATAEAYGRNLTLRSVEARPSRLSGTRTIVDVIFSYANRATDVLEKQFVRVDVTERFPFLVTKLSPYYDR